MKQKLNLKALRFSKKRKHNKIYEKSVRFREEGSRTPYLKEEEILEIAGKYPTLDVKVLIGGNISIKSFKDNWVIVDEGRFYSLYHKGTIFDKGRIKDMYHIQDIFKDLNYIFASVVSHDDYAMGIKKRTLVELEELVQH